MHYGCEYSSDSSSRPSTCGSTTTITTEMLNAGVTCKHPYHQHLFWVLATGGVAIVKRAA